MDKKTVRKLGKRDLHLHLGVVFDTPFERTCEALESPDTITRSFAGIDSEGVEVLFSVAMVTELWCGGHDIHYRDDSYPKV